MDLESADMKVGFAQLARPIFIKWEKLRMVYNIILVAFVLYVFSPALDKTMIAFYLYCLIGAVLANFCFLAGPLTETYAAWLGFKSHWFTSLLFVGGLVVSIPLVWLYLFTFMH